MSFNSVIFIIFTIGFSFSSIAQSERKITRKGNAQYETGNFVDAEINYKKAIEKNASLLEAEFNLGDALVKQERFDEALESFNKVSSSTEDPVLKANALHNKGNVHLSQQDLESALESYKDALRINPKDNETRYNYAYVKKLLDQQQDQEEKEQEQNEENKDNNKEDKEQKENNEEKGDQQNEDSENKDQDNPENQENENKDEQQDKGENKEDESKQEQQDKGQTDGEDAEEEKEKEGEQPKPKENKLSPEEAQRLLEALKQEENKVQEKMKKHKIKGAKVKIEKDW